MYGWASLEWKGLSSVVLGPAGSAYQGSLLHWTEAGWDGIESAQLRSVGLSSSDLGPAGLTSAGLDGISSAGLKWSGLF